jgi:hypothetical protein
MPWSTPVAQTEMSVQYRPQEVTVTLSTEEARRWSEGDQVGLYCEFAIGDKVLAVLIEKDFACLEGSDLENEHAEQRSAGRRCDDERPQT